VAGASVRSRATVVVGVQPVLAINCVMPELHRFHESHPGIVVDIRDFTRPTPEQMAGVDVFLVMGWPEVKDLVHRQIAQGRYVVCAAPQYWARHGMPLRPRDLEHHACLALRSVNGPIMDWWSFRRGDEEEDVAVSGWLIASNTHRDLLHGVALAGGGVVRTLDLAQRNDLRAGRLIAALTDWEAREVPPVNLLYSPDVRRMAHVRAFIEFAIDLFGQLEAERDRKVYPGARPRWLGTRQARTSAARSRK